MLLCVIETDIKRNRRKNETFCGFFALGCNEDLWAKAALTALMFERIRFGGTRGIFF